MSILVPGMEMPTCYECPFETYGYCFQLHDYHVNHRKPGENRPSECPLLEIPPHGDLIDRDHLSVVCYTGAEGLEDTFDNGVAWTLEYIDKLTPVIPAAPEGGADG